MTDVWTSKGVLLRIGAVVVTGWERLDPIIALLVAANIVCIGAQLVRRSALGLLDSVTSRPSGRARLGATVMPMTILLCIAARHRAIIRAKPHTVDAPRSAN
jgi:hypothetical protein